MEYFLIPSFFTPLVSLLTLVFVVALFFRGKTKSKIHYHTHSETAENFVRSIPLPAMIFNKNRSEKGFSLNDRCQKLLKPQDLGWLLGLSKALYPIKSFCLTNFEEKTFIRFEVQYCQYQDVCYFIFIPSNDQDLISKKENALKNLQEEQLTKLSRNLAHNINNPLAIVRGSLDLLAKYREDEGKFMSKLDAAIHATQRITKTINELRKFSHLGESNYRSKCSLNNIIEDCVENLLPVAREERIKIGLDLKSTSQIYCNQLEIEQCILLWLNNSFRDLQNIDLKWVHFKTWDEENSIMLEITDSRSGFTEDSPEKHAIRQILDDHEAKAIISTNSDELKMTIRFHLAEIAYVA